ncbi:MAG: tRNA uridine-5-carboxymethylaminomethyl(34) synthesis GTPase MnmE [Lentisphaeria bacterium]|nr:tRNA uridine-5-carboxymethylaminomethyl(34) synthesis GTPase MnmE [Lentisphaeria bacterium]MBR3505606.1 tRNA uridine-5-carboxymethylaminomethyl(34) synthesis GTPase MnmE [Lentisphaeria bacterium]
MFEHENDTIAAICTGTGGAVSIIRISGPRALGVVRKVWHGKRMPGPDFPRVMLYGHIVSGSPETGPGAGEPSLAVFMPGPHSFTGEDVAEIHCHGGSFAARRALRLVLQAGARLAQNGEFTRRAFLNGKLDLTQAEGVLDLINAGSERAGLLAERQLNGSVGSAVREIRSEVVRLLSECESRLDFSEEDLDWMPPETLCAQIISLREQAVKLALTARTGTLIRDGVSLVIAGPPNAGKSSLLNRMLGYDRAIVTPIPGTTRDTLEESVSIGGIPFRVTDTAGLREAGDADPVEAMGMERSQQSLGTADIVLWLLDASAPPESFPAQFEAMNKAKSAVRGKFIPCWNKMDGASLPPDELDRAHATGNADPDHEAAGPVFEHISARTGDGIDRLFRRLEETAWNGMPPAAQSGDAVVSERHAALLEQAANHLGAACECVRAGSWELAGSSLRTAAELIGCITGETATPDVLDEIFSRFCIGK